MAQAWIKLLDQDEEIKYHLPAVRELLEEWEYLWEPYHTIDQICDMIVAKSFQLWSGGVDDEAEIYALTQFLTWPNCKTMSIVWCAGGDGERYFEPFTQEVEKLGKMLGCIRVDIQGRTGWKRQLEPLGYKTLNLILTKDIFDGQGTTE